MVDPTEYVLLAIVEGSYPAPSREEPRFVVQEYGPRDFWVYDTASRLSYDPRFTRRGAQEAADRRNAQASQ